MRFALFATVLALFTSLVAAQTPFHLGLHLVQNIVANVSLVNAVATNKAQASFTAKNPVPFPITIKSISAVTGEGSDVYATFNQNFNNFQLPAKGNGNSGFFPLTLTKGAIGSLGLLNQKTIDLIAANVSITAFSINYPITLSYIFQNGIPIQFNIS